MGSQSSPVIANLYMENLETEALNSLQIPLKFYKRYVDDTFFICKKITQMESCRTSTPTTHPTVEKDKHHSITKGQN